MFDYKLEKDGRISSVRMHFLSEIKATTLVVTALAMFAVDFPPLFGRHLCKTEDAGWSLMDHGVAAIVLNAACGHRLIIQHPSTKNKSWL